MIFQANRKSATSAIHSGQSKDREQHDALTGADHPPSPALEKFEAASQPNAAQKRADQFSRLKLEQGNPEKYPDRE
jgi:hypothetical protein